MVDTTLDPDAVNLSKAIRQTESGGDFTARGKSGEYGAYQFTKPTWDSYAKKHGVNASLERATPEQQNEVAYKQIKEWKDSGYNPGQIASLWNSGKPDAYLDTNYKGKNKLGVTYDVPAYAKSVATAYQQIKQGSQVNADPQNPSSIANTTPVQSPKQERILGSIVSGITDPISQLGGTITNAINPNGKHQIEGITGNKVDTLGYRDNQKLGGTDTAKQVAGNIAQNASNLILPEAKGALATKGILSKAYQGAKVFGKIGALQSGGQSLEQGNDLGTVAVDTAKGGALGAGLGAVTGGSAGLLNRATMSKVESQALKDTDLIKNRIDQLGELDKYVNVKKIVDNGTKYGIDVKKNLANTNLLSMPGVVDETGTIRTLEKGGVVDEYKNWLSPKESSVRDALAREGTTVDYRQVLSDLQKTLENGNIKGADLNGAVSGVKQEVGSLLQKYPNGKIPLAEIQDLKVYKSQGNNYLNPTKNLEDKAIANGLKRIIEKHSKSIEVVKLNKELQGHYQTIDYLEALNNKKVAGGKLGKYFAQVVGGMVGSHFGPFGTYVGSNVAGKIEGKALAGKLGGNKQISGGMLKDSPLMKRTVIKNKFYKQMNP